MAIIGPGCRSFVKNEAGLAVGALNSSGIGGSSGIDGVPSGVVAGVVGSK